MFAFGNVEEVDTSARYQTPINSACVSHGAVIYFRQSVLNAGKGVRRKPTKGFGVDQFDDENRQEMTIDVSSVVS